MKVSVEVHKENKTTQTIGNYHTRGTVNILHLCTWLQYSQKLGNGTHQQMNGERKYEIYANYIHKGILLGCKENEIITFVGKWMRPEIII